MITQGTTYQAPPMQATRTVQFEKIQCNWCSQPATWQIVDHTAGLITDVTCTDHGHEWFPEAFQTTLPKPATGTPLVDHRAGLRRNDLVTLASAFWIMANRENRLG